MVVERAQPWLGTLVSIRAAASSSLLAHKAIDAAFEEVAIVHRKMSFHASDSDISEMNREASRKPVAPHRYTLDVLRWALQISAASNGCFDVSIGADMVSWGMLPYPASVVPPAGGNWRDIELRTDGTVIFHRPLWIDLGGIAKGYAVDRAMECLRGYGVEYAVVNAGGDLRVYGSQSERVALEIETWTDALPVLELTEGSMASSCGRRSRRFYQGRLCGPHIHGRRRSPAPANRFVCVVAERCVVADALTKVAIAEGARSAAILRKFQASAYLHDPGEGWRHVAEGPEAP